MFGKMLETLKNFPENLKEKWSFYYLWENVAKYRASKDNIKFLQLFPHFGGGRAVQCSMTLMLKENFK